MDSQRSFRIITIGLIVLILLIVASIIASVLTGNLSKKIQEKSSVSQNQPNLLPTLKERSIYLDLPQNFPRDIPLPQTARVTAKEEDNDSWKATFLVADNAALVRDFYLKSLASSSWKITGQSQAAGLTIINLSRDGRSAIAAIGSTDGGTSVSLTILKGQ